MSATIRDVQSGVTGALTAVVPVAGDAIVVIQYVLNSEIGTATAPTDSKGNTYTQVGTNAVNSASNIDTQMWLAKNVAAGSTVVTLHAGASGKGTAWFLTGVDVNPYNGDVSVNNGTGTPVGPGPTSPAPAANSIFIGSGHVARLPSVNPPAGWNTTGVNGFTAGMNTNTEITGSGVTGKSAYIVASAVQSCIFATTNVGWSGIVASFGPALPPIATSVSPSKGSSVGGTPITITGSQFADGATVTVGGTPATNVVKVNSTTITATAPAHAVGTAVITVTQSAGSSSLLASQFSYEVPPVPTSITPQYALRGTPTNVTIRGTGFVNGATVDFDGTPGTNVVVVNSTTITCDVPTHVAGASVVTVTNP